MKNKSEDQARRWRTNQNNKQKNKSKKNHPPSGGWSTYFCFL